MSSIALSNRCLTIPLTLPLSLQQTASTSGGELDDSYSIQVPSFVLYLPFLFLTSDKVSRKFYTNPDSRRIHILYFHKLQSPHCNNVPIILNPKRTCRAGCYGYTRTPSYSFVYLSLSPLIYRHALTLPRDRRRQYTVHFF